MSKDQKKHQKAIKREKKKEDASRSYQERLSRHQERLSRHQEMLSRQRMNSLYPGISFAGEADPKFEELIRSTVAGLPFHSSCFPEWERDVYRVMKARGFPRACGKLRDLDKDAAKAGALPVDHEFMSSYGSKVFERCGCELVPFLLKNDVCFQPTDRDFVARFCKLDEVSMAGKSVFTSPYRPVSIINGVSYTVCFSNHAIEQIANRVHPTWQGYAGHGDVFALLHDTTHFVGCEILGESGRSQPAVAMFQRYLPSASVRAISTQSLVAAFCDDDGSGRYILIGYLPVALHDGFSVAKTYLRPGWCKTPEYLSYFNKSVPYDVGELLRSIGTEEHPANGFLHSHPDILRFFFILVDFLRFDAAAMIVSHM